MGYYYFATTLPSLYFKEDVKADSKEFLANAKNFLKAKHFKVMSDLKFDLEHKALTKEGISWQEKLKEIKLYSLGLVTKQSDKDSTLSPIIRDRLKAVISNSNPLEREVEIMNIQFDVAKDFSKLSPFKVGNLYTYYLQLQILERYNSFDKMEGFQVFKSIASNVQST